MSVQSLIRCALACLFAAPLCLHAEPFAAKPGAWELTTTTVTTGAFIPPDEIAKMKPEERAQLEKHMQEASGKPVTRVTRTCMTRERLDQESMTAFKNGGPCKRKVVSKTAKKIVVERTCPAPRASTATWTAEAPTPETMNATSDVVLQAGGKMHMEIKGKWLGASCEGMGKR